MLTAAYSELIFERVLRKPQKSEKAELKIQLHKFDIYRSRSQNQSNLLFSRAPVRAGGRTPRTLQSGGGLTHAQGPHVAYEKK